MVKVVDSSAYTCFIWIIEPCKQSSNDHFTEKHVYFIYQSCQIFRAGRVSFHGIAFVFLCFENFRHPDFMFGAAGTRYAPPLASVGFSRCFYVCVWCGLHRHTGIIRDPGIPLACFVICDISCRINRVANLKASHSAPWNWQYWQWIS